MGRVTRVIDPAEHTGGQGIEPILRGEVSPQLQAGIPAHLSGQKPLLLTTQRHAGGEDPGSHVVNRQREGLPKGTRPARHRLRATRGQWLRAADDGLAHRHLVAVTRGEEIREDGIRVAATGAVDPEHGNALADAEQELRPRRALTHRVAPAQAQAVGTELGGQHRIPPGVWRLQIGDDADAHKCYNWHEDPGGKAHARGQWRRTRTGLDAPDFSPSFHRRCRLGYPGDTPLSRRMARMDEQEGAIESARRQ